MGDTHGAEGRKDIRLIITNPISMSSQEQIKQDKIKIIEELRKVPIILVVCQKVGISRATIYRWMKEDSVFEKEVETAKHEGTQGINDLAESKLISNIQKGDNTAIIYWLKFNHPKYRESYLRLEPTIQNQLQTLLKQKGNLFERVLSLVIEGKISTSTLSKLSIVLERYQNAKTQEKRQKEYEMLQTLLKK